MKEKIIRVLKIEPQKPPVEAELKNELSSLQEAVGGLIEFLALDSSKGIELMCNEEGKLLGMEYNRALCDESGAVYDILCGPFFICGLGEEDFTSLSDALADKYCKYFERPELFVRVGGTLMVMRA